MLHRLIQYYKYVRGRHVTRGLRTPRSEYYVSGRGQQLFSYATTVLEPARYPNQCAGLLEAIAKGRGGLPVKLTSSFAECVS
jgi:hypothetical protein